MKNWLHYFPHWGFKRFSHLAPFLEDTPKNEDELSYARWLQEQEKSELHVHLEAAVSASFYEVLNYQKKLFSEQLLPHKRVPFASLKDFIGAWLDQTRLISSPQQYAELLVSFYELRKSHNITYSEVHCSLLDYSLLRKRFSPDKAAFDFEEMLLSLLEKRRELYERYPQNVVRLILDVVWISNIDERMHVIDVCRKIMKTHHNLWFDEDGTSAVAGIGMGGPEVIGKMSENEIKETMLFVDQVKELDLKIDLHSGENVSAEDHIKTCELFLPDRVSHGISAADRGFFYAKGISVCPLSNYLIGNTKDLKDHPIKKMWESNILFSVNTDDPLLLNTNLTIEYLVLRNLFGFERMFFRKTQENARAIML